MDGFALACEGLFALGICAILMMPPRAPIPPRASLSCLLGSMVALTARYLVQEGSVPASWGTRVALVQLAGGVLFAATGAWLLQRSKA